MNLNELYAEIEDLAAKVQWLEKRIAALEAKKE